MKLYNEVKKLTKSEILNEYKKLVEDYEELESAYNNLNEWAGEQENSAYEANAKLEELTKADSNDPAIISIGDFKRRLSVESMLSSELEEFIDNYLRYYNKVGEQIK